ncbi:MAG TPA: alpha-galactosidase, partial [Gemmatimonadales bacterium]
ALASFATGALIRRGPSGDRALAWMFEPGEPGTGRATLAAAAIEVRTDWTPPRPIRTAGDAGVLRLAFDPAGNPLTALRAAAAPSDADRDRLAALAAPAGWCSWYELGPAVTEDAVIANLAAAAAAFDRRHFRYVQLDDGYQKSVGDWDAGPAFPHGHRWLTDQIHAKGLLAGLWIAPFGVSERSGIPAAHPDWLIAGPDGPVAPETRDRWGGKVFVLDGAHPDVQAHLHDLARRVVQDWGYDYLKIDFLLWSALGAGRAGGATQAEAYHAGLRALRDGLGPEAFLLGCGAPLQHAAGLVDGMRIGTDVDASWGAIGGPARAAALRSYAHRTLWLNDPDCLVVRPPLTLDEARAWTSVVALSGGAAICSDDLTKLPAERIALLQRAFPAALVAGRPVGVTAPATEVAPALVAGDAVFPIGGPFHFRTGDDPGYAARMYDESAWETIPVPGHWEDAGHPDYDGFAWYRTRFTVAAAAAPAHGGVVLELGKLDDADETYLNGVKLGATGTLPPDYQGDWQAYRRYAVPPDAVNWGGENVLAVRVYDGGGPGGWWSVRRDAPPATWVASPAAGWWTVTHVNWDAAAADVSLPLAGLGIAGGPFEAYDVWSDRPLPPVKDAVAARVPPHAALTVALRSAAAHPQIIGSTRHIVQGAVDVANETWDAKKRMLGATAVRLDGRAYAVTIAVPRAFTPGACTADRACTVRRLDTGHVVLEWPAGDGGDIAWALTFRRPAAPRRP